MRHYHILRRILRETGAHRVWTGFLLQLLFTALIIWLREPEIHTYREAVWYCYAVVTTIGFGDIVVHCFISRVLSILLSVSALFVIAILTAVVVNYFNAVSAARSGDTLMVFMDKLERLPELSPEELKELSDRVKEYRLRQPGAEKEKK